MIYKNVINKNHNADFLKKLIYMIIFLFLNFQMFPQSFAENPTQLKEIPPAPTMWEFQKYGDYPVGMHTGVPSISIPLGEVVCGSLTVPISVNYHASGIKVEQRASNVGLGWTLMAGGSITRVIRGGNDDGSFGYAKSIFEEEGTFDSALNSNYYKTEEYIQGIKDSEPDLFYYDFLGYSGKFLLKPNSYPYDANDVIQIPFNDLKITPASDFNSFVITTPEGVSAVFSATELTSESRSGMIQPQMTVSGVGTWHLTTLTGPQGIDEITFEYQNVGQPTIVPDVATQSETVNYFDPCWDYNYTVTPNNVQPNRWYSLVKKISKINFKDGYVLFNHSSGNRIDDPNNEELQLDSIVYFSNFGLVEKKIKSFVFDYGYFGTVDQYTTSNSVRRKLEKIYYEAPDGSRNNPYEFTYKDGPSGYDKLPDRLSKAQDFWGYYNGKGNNTLAPKIQYEVNPGVMIDLGDANRDVDPNYTKAGIIQRITYPTLGYTEFEFENNTATINNSQFITGGLRVKSINKFNSDGSFRGQKTYGYTQKNNPTKSSGVYNGANYIKADDFKHSRTYYFNELVNGMGSNSCTPSGQYLTYTTRSTIVASTPTINNNLATTFYSTVKEINGDFTNYEGYTWYTYASNSDYRYQGAGPILFSIDRGWDRGQLLLEEVYENGNPNPIKTTTNTYYTEDIATIKGFKAGTRFDVQSLGFVPINYGDPYGFRYQQYLLVYYTEYSKWKRLQSSETVFDGVTTLVDYSYNNSNKHINPIKQTTVSSEGKTMDTKYYYPDDIENTNSIQEGPALTGPEKNEIDKLKDNLLHIKNMLVQTSTIVNGTVTSIERNTFKTDDNIVVREFIKTAKGGGTSLSLENRVEFVEYDNGKLTKVKKTDGSSIYYIWGYNKSLPIAKIENMPSGNLSSVVAEVIEKSNIDTSKSAEEQLLIEFASLRNAYPDALITTYTYDLLKGITSITDPKGYTTRYVYDKFNRLKYIKDHNENIINEYDYHFKVNN